MNQKETERYFKELWRKWQEAAEEDEMRGHVEVRITDAIYVYLHEDGIHTHTRRLPIPESWWDRWPAEATVRRYIRRHGQIGSAPITTLDA